MHFIAQFFAGAFLCNCIPHLAAGLMGQPFPSPFSTPPGKGDSAPLVNFFWGFFNLLAGLALLKAAPAAIGLNIGFAVFLLGALILGALLARNFGAVRAHRMSTNVGK
jgi:hypothetical protein